MSYRSAVFAVMLLAVAAALIFQFFQRRLSEPMLAFGVHPEIIRMLADSRDDQRELAILDPAAESRYRERFEKVESLLQHLRVLQHNRDDIVGRFEQLMLVLYAATTVFVIGGVVLRQRRQEWRLGRIQSALAVLASGGTDIAVGDPRRDVIGRIAGMIEGASERMARDQRRLRTLRNLSAWQEAARRHAHEMRTPLTAAKLELERVRKVASEARIEDRLLIDAACESAAQELERLRRFTTSFTSFARLPQPRLRKRDVKKLADEFVATYSAAWENLTLSCSAGDGPYVVEIDRDMLRQVLVNLCDNASAALAGAPVGRGTILIEVGSSAGMVWVDVGDNGPGISAEVRECLFEPYTTTRGLGDGMGLGLAICRKILLDHGGDLELLESSRRGTVFRLILKSG